MIDLHVQNAAYSIFDGITDPVKNIRGKPWLKTAICSHLRRLMRLKNPPVIITEEESYKLFEMWLEWKKEEIK